MEHEYFSVSSSVMSMNISGEKPPTGAAGRCSGGICSIVRIRLLKSSSGRLFPVAILNCYVTLKAG